MSTVIDFDVESNGTDPQRDQILSFCMKAIDAVTGEVKETLRLKLAHRGDTLPDPEAVIVNRVNPLRAEGMSEAECTRRVSEFVARHGGRNSPFVGHRVSFDLRFLRNGLTRNGHDAKSISLSHVDTYTETVRHIFDKAFPVDKLALREGKYGPTISLSQVDVARALDIPVDESRAHDDEYDVDINSRIWDRLGRPLPKTRTPLDNPYETQKNLAGKVIRVKEWDSFSNRIQERSFFVTGKGAYDAEDSFGKVRFKDTVLVELGTAEFDSAVARLRKASNERGSALTESALKAITQTRGFSANSVLEFEETTLDEVLRPKVAAPPDENATSVADRNSAPPATMEELKTLSDIVVEREIARRREEREKVYADRLNAAASEVFYLTDPGNKLDMVSAADEPLIPGLARRLASLTEDERHGAISELANAQVPPRGILWAHAMLKLAERYGYRNGIDGFETARRRDLAVLLPERLQEVAVAKTPDGVPKGVAKLMAGHGISAITISCDGTKVSVTPHDRAGLPMGSREIPHVEKRNGLLEKQKVEATERQIMDILGCSQNQAKDVRKGFELFVDNSSYAALKRRFRASAAAAREDGDEAGAILLDEVLSDLGSSYDELLEKTSRRRFRDDPNPPTGGATSGDADVFEPSIDDSAAEAIVEVPTSPAGPAPEPPRLPAALSEDSEPASPREPKPESNQALTETGGAHGEGSKKKRGGLRVRVGTAEQLRIAMLQADELRKEAEAAYASETVVRLPADASDVDIVAANLRNPATESLKTIDAQAARRRLFMIKRYGHASLSTPSPDTSSSSAAGSSDLGPWEALDHIESAGLSELAPSRCKVCRRTVRGTNLVAGMGPTCARKLGDWLSRAGSERSHYDERRFRKLSDVKDPKSGGYPIMIVRDAKTGRMFPADIIRREKDGRYLVIDLSEVSRSSSGGPRRNLIRDALRIYLDPQSYQVARVYGLGDDTPPAGGGLRLPA